MKSIPSPLHPYKCLHNNVKVPVSCQASYGQIYHEVKAECEQFMHQPGLSGL